LVKGPGTAHAAQAEHLHGLLLPAQFGHHLIPVHLTFLAPRIRLRHERLPMDQANLQFLFPHVLPHGRFGYLDLRLLYPQPVIDAVRCVPLFTRRRQIVLDNRVDEWNRRLQFRSRPLALFPLLRHGISQRFSYHAPVNPQLPRHSLDRSGSELVLPSDRLK
jgi:hypothetical protein